MQMTRIRMETQARQIEEKKNKEKKKNILVYIQRYLLG